MGGNRKSLKELVYINRQRQEGEERQYRCPVRASGCPKAAVKRVRAGSDRIPDLVQTVRNRQGAARIRREVGKNYDREVQPWQDGLYLLEHGDDRTFQGKYALSNTTYKNEMADKKSSNIIRYL